MASTLRDLIERLEQYVEEKGLDADKTFFWVCDFCVRQSGGNADDVDRFGDVVQSIGKTVMFLEPWDKMIKTRPSDRVNCLSRAWCVAGPTSDMRARRPRLRTPTARPRLALARRRGTVVSQRHLAARLFRHAVSDTQAS